MIGFNFLATLVSYAVQGILAALDPLGAYDGMSTAIDLNSYAKGDILGKDPVTGEIIYDTSDPLPDHDLLIEDLGVSPNDDHLTSGC